MMRECFLEAYVSPSPGHFFRIPDFDLSQPALLVRRYVALDWSNSAQQLKKRSPNFVVCSVDDVACRLSRSHARPRAFQDCWRIVDHSSYANMACCVVLWLISFVYIGNNWLYFW